MIGVTTVLLHCSDSMGTSVAPDQRVVMLIGIGSACRDSSAGALGSLKYTARRSLETGVRGLL